MMRPAHRFLQVLQVLPTLRQLCIAPLTHASGQREGIAPQPVGQRRLAVSSHGYSC